MAPPLGKCKRRPRVGRRYGMISCTTSMIARRRDTRSPQTRSKSATSGWIFSGGVAAAPATPSPPRAEGPQRPWQMIGLVPMVEARAFGLRHLGADRETGFGHGRLRADVRIVDREDDLQRARKS